MLPIALLLPLLALPFPQGSALPIPSSFNLNRAISAAMALEQQILFRSPSSPSSSLSHSKGKHRPSLASVRPSSSSSSKTAPLHIIDDSSLPLELSDRWNVPDDEEVDLEIEEEQEDLAEMDRESIYASLILDAPSFSAVASPTSKSSSKKTKTPKTPAAKVPSSTQKPSRAPLDSINLPHSHTHGPKKSQLANLNSRPAVPVSFGVHSGRASIFSATSLPLPNLCHTSVPTSTSRYVQLSPSLFSLFSTTSSGKNSLCDKFVSVSYGGKEVTLRVGDVLKGEKEEFDIAVSEGVWGELLGEEGKEERSVDVKWRFV